MSSAACRGHCCLKMQRVGQGCSRRKPWDVRLEAPSTAVFGFSLSVPISQMQPSHPRWHRPQVSPHSPVQLGAELGGCKVSHHVGVHFRVSHFWKLPFQEACLSLRTQMNARLPGYVAS